MRYRLSTAPRFVALLTTLSQEWAAQGIHALRLDWLGVTQSYGMQTSSIPFDPHRFFLEDHGTAGGVNCCICHLRRERRFAIFIQLNGHLLGPIGSSCLFEKVLPTSVLPSHVLIGQLDSIAKDLLSQRHPKNIQRAPLSTWTLPRLRNGWPLPEEEQHLVRKLLTTRKLHPEVQRELSQYLEFGLWNAEQLHAIHALYRRRVDRQHPRRELDLPRTPSQPLYSRRFRDYLSPFIPAAWVPLCGRIDATGKSGGSIEERQAVKLLETARQHYLSGQ